MAEKAKKKLSGRRVLYSNETVITRSNIVEVLNSVLTDFNQNKADIIYLYNYYRNIQPVDKREKEIPSRHQKHRCYKPRLRSGVF